MGRRCFFPSTRKPVGRIFDALRPVWVGQSARKLTNHYFKGINRFILFGCSIDHFLD
jgi:hypothetical protein